MKVEKTKKDIDACLELVQMFSGNKEAIEGTVSDLCVTAKSLIDDLNTQAAEIAGLRERLKEAEQLKGGQG